jgi:hypothetical protein
MSQILGAKVLEINLICPIPDIRMHRAISNPNALRKRKKKNRSAWSRGLPLEKNAKGSQFGL